MRVLVAFYSRTGKTRNIAKQISDHLGSDIDEIKDKKSRSGIIGWLSGGKDSFMRKQTEIESAKNPEDYDLIIVGSPVWAGTMAPAVRTYLSKNNFKSIAFFCTYDSSQGNTFKEMQELTSEPKTTLGLSKKEMEHPGEKVKEFCEKLVRPQEEKSSSILQDKIREQEPEEEDNQA